MSTSVRPGLKRQYGAKHHAQSSSSSVSSRSSPSFASVTNATTSSDWDSVLEEEEEGRMGAAAEADRSFSPPTSPSASSAAPFISKASAVVGGKRRQSVQQENEDVEMETGKKQQPHVKSSNTLLSFFRPVSPKQRKRSRSLKSNDLIEGEEESQSKRKLNIKSSSTPASLPARPASSSSRLSSTSASKFVSSTKLSKSAPSKLEQLYLDPFTTSGHSTLSCTVCSLSYARTPDDILLHDKYHKRVVAGCDWVSMKQGENGGTVIEDEIEWGSKGKKKERRGMIVTVDAGVEGVIGRKIKLILDTIDTSLSATALNSDQLAKSKLFLFLNSKKKVIACAVIERIVEAYQVVSSKHVGDPLAADAQENDWMRFGEEEGAVFCSRTASPALLGVQRIWTSPFHRRASLASQLLDAAAHSFIYGYPIFESRRKVDVAFSQPTGDGMELARKWTGTAAYKVFVE